ncbi:hypothetical protein E2C01_037534 [Portunus trituberculatus]|uniref:Uncharacterized protein n=1 Tax=Portunus trituberculatus TaxID=210409 RepID=A0A5B7F8D9_PORTR|nr:hypothetical protein [Portunus trituberculatus]
MLAHLTSAQRKSYSSLVGVLQRRFGQHQQVEAYRACIKTRVQGRGEPLSQLAQESEMLVCRTYLTAAEDMAHLEDVQAALVKLLKMETFLHTTMGSGMTASPWKANPTRDIRAQRTEVGKATEKRVDEGATGLCVSCWGCGERGYRRTPVAAIGLVTPRGFSATTKMGLRTWRKQLLGGVGTVTPKEKPTARVTWRSHQRPHGYKEDLDQAEAALLLGGMRRNVKEGSARYAVPVMDP